MGPLDNHLPSQGIQATEFISGLDIDKPAILSTLYVRNGDQWKGSFMKMLQMFSFELGVDQDTFTHFEDDWYIRTIRVGEDAIPAATGAGQAAFDIPVDPLDVFTDANTGTHLFPLVGDIIQLPDGSGVNNLQASVIAVDPASPKITVQFIKNAWTTGSGFAAGTKIIVISNAFAEGTGQPKGTIRNIRKKTGRTQIFKASWQGTGTEMTNGKWITETSEGQSINRYWAYGMEQVDYTMMKSLDTQFLTGQATDADGITDPLPDNTGRPVRTTEGLDPAIETEGYDVPYTAGMFAVPDFDEMSANAEQENGGDAFAVCYGFPVGQEFENLMVNYNKDTFISYVSEEAREKIVHIGFKQITKSERTFMWKKLGTLSHPMLYGAEGFENYKNRAYVIPTSGNYAYETADKRGAETRPHLCIRWKMSNGYDRRSEVYEINGTMHRPALRPVIAQDVDNLYNRANGGLQKMALNKFQRLIGEV